VKTQAEALLRSIDAEEFSQQQLTASRTFDAGLSAFHRHEYPQASTIFRTINPAMLAVDKQKQLGEIMGLPEMRTAQVTPAVAQGPSALGAGAGAARATDNSPEADLLKQTLAMQEIKFQQLREDGRKVMSQATELFQAGDTDRALDLLQDYSMGLRDSQLDPDRQALLRRPVEARLAQYRTLKAQKDFAKLQNGQRDATANAHTQREMAELKKQKDVSDLMKQYYSFFKEGKYAEAEKYARLAKEIDPDNPVIDSAIIVSKTQRRQVEAQKLKSDKEKMVLGGLNDTDDEGVFASARDPIKYDSERWKKAQERKGDLLRGIVMQTETDERALEKQKEIEHKLNMPINLNFHEVHLGRAIQDLKAMTGINIVLDSTAMSNEGISESRPVTIALENVSLKSALNLLLHQVNMTYVIKNEVLNITTERESKGKCVPRTYQVADLVIPVENFTLAPAHNLTNVLNDQAAHSLLPGSSITSTPVAGSRSLTNGTGVSNPLGTPVPVGPGLASNGTMSQGSGGHTAGETMQDVLIKLIKDTIQPASWNDMGGHGTIEYYPLGLALVVNQTPDIQEQVADLLAALRRLQDQEVTVEVRFISVAESFFEHVGVNFNVNLNMDNRTKNLQPLLTSGQFRPDGFVNSIPGTTGGFLSGLTPAGAFTPDLNIPITNSSFGYAVPPFGNFPNIPGGNGGTALGLAFLSDIQVFMFMEAAQQDMRTNVMQAPKLTLFNGQTSTITITDTQFFVTNVTVVQLNGQLSFVPTNTPIPTGGVTMTVQAVISADRRYVRLSLTPTLTNLTTANIPLFPIVTPIFPIFEGGFQGPPVLFTQFIQQPAFNTITLSTSVNVPDGGTVLLGGLKRLSEGRNESGPPVLSKIPYLNRLFKNTAYGREAESLLMMVTPRIIINEEEETNQTGVITAPRSSGF
jgi:type II secretory pathway component GspD/PulD (secretin)